METSLNVYYHRCCYIIILLNIIKRCICSRQSSLFLRRDLCREVSFAINKLLRPECDIVIFLCSTYVEKVVTKEATTHFTHYISAQIHCITVLGIG